MGSFLAERRFLRDWSGPWAELDEDGKRKLGGKIIFAFLHGFGQKSGGELGEIERGDEGFSAVSERSSGGRLRRARFQGKGA